MHEVYEICWKGFSIILYDLLYLKIFNLICDCIVQIYQNEFLGNCV